MSSLGQPAIAEEALADASPTNDSARVPGHGSGRQKGSGMSNVIDLARAGKATRVTAHEGDTLLVRFEAATVAPPDELRPVAAWAEAWGLERKGLESAIRRAGVPTIRVGRLLCVRRSDVLALVDKLATKRTESKPSTASTYDDLVASARGRR